MGAWNWLDWTLAVIVAVSVAASAGLMAASHEGETAEGRDRDIAAPLAGAEFAGGGLVLIEVGQALFDRILGGIFGLARGVGIAMVLLMTMMAFGLKTEALHQSVLAPYAANLARPLANLMPEDFRTRFQAGLDKLKQALIQQDKKQSK